MDALSDRQRRLLARLPREQRFARVAGLALSLAGILYIVWGIARFDPAGNPIDAVGFDAPVAMPVATLYSEASAKVAVMQVETPRERALAWRLGLLLDFSGGLSLLAFRVILGTIATMLGFAVLTVMIERSRLLGVIRALGVEVEAPAAVAAASSGVPSPEDSPPEV